MYSVMNKLAAKHYNMFLLSLHYLCDKPNDNIRVLFFILLYCINVSLCITAFDCIRPTACFVQVVFHYPSSIA